MSCGDEDGAEWGVLEEVVGNKVAELKIGEGWKG